MNTRTLLTIATLLFGASTVGMAQSIPANSQPTAGQQGWKCKSGYVERANKCIRLADASDDEIRQALIAESLSSYPGSCPCPYNVDRGGRRCGRRSAYSRPGGRSPLCYASDVSDEAVRKARQTTSKDR